MAKDYGGVADAVFGCHRHDKRLTLRALVMGEGVACFPGAFSPLSAHLIEKDGFEGVRSGPPPASRSS